MWHLHTCKASLSDLISNMDLDFLKLEIHIRTRVLGTRFASVIDLKSFYAKKKNFTYSGVFKPYSDVLKPYSDVFLQKKKF